MKKISLLLLLMVGLLLQSIGQLTVADDNNVGIGITEPVSKLSIGGDGYATSALYVESNSAVSGHRAAFFRKMTSGGTWGYGMISSISLENGNYQVGGYFTSYSASAISNRRTYGVKAIAGNASDGFNYGVYGYLYGTKNGAAIFGATPGKLDCNTNGIWAGYFRGDVYVEDDIIVDGLYNPSDINIKKDVQLLSNEETSQVDKIMTLSAIKYKYKTPTELNRFEKAVLDTASIDPRTIEYSDEKYTKDRIGLSAQEVQIVYPELVKESSDGYLSLNYVGLIPVLVDALKEQEAEIEVLRQEIEKLKDSTKTK